MTGLARGHRPLRSCFVLVIGARSRLGRRPRPALALDGVIVATALPYAEDPSRPGRPARRPRPLRRALPLADRQRLPRRRPERLARRVLVAHRRGAPRGRPDRRRGRRRTRARRGRRARRRLRTRPATGPSTRPRTARTACCCLPPTIYRANRGEVVDHFAKVAEVGPADHGLQQPDRHQGRPHAGPARRARADRARRGGQGVLRRRPPRAGDPGTRARRRP